MPLSRSRLRRPVFPCVSYTYRGEINAAWNTGDENRVPEMWREMIPTPGGSISAGRWDVKNCRSENLFILFAVLETGCLFPLYTGVSAAFGFVKSWSCSANICWFWLGSRTLGQDRSSSFPRPIHHLFCTLFKHDGYRRHSRFCRHRLTLQLEATQRCGSLRAHPVKKSTVHCGRDLSETFMIFLKCSLHQRVRKCPTAPTAEAIKQLQ